MESLREHWEWSGGYAIIWIVVTVALFAGAHLLFNYLSLDFPSRVLAFVMLSTLILVNPIWRAIGTLAARLE